MNEKPEDYAIDSDAHSLLFECENNLGKYLTNFSTEIAKKDNSYIELDGLNYINIKKEHVEAANSKIESLLMQITDMLGKS
jgi:hypothetical protein